MPRIDGDQLGITAAGEEGADFVADLPAQVRATAGRDDSGDFQSGNVGGHVRRWRIMSFALQHVGAVCPGAAIR